MVIVANTMTEQRISFRDFHFERAYIARVGELERYLMVSINFKIYLLA